MPDRRILAALALVICLPLLLASLGVGRYAGLAIGVLLVLVGLGSLLFGSRRERDP